MLLPLIAAGAAGIAYSTLVERHWWAIRRYDVPCLPPGMASIRVLHLSDLHFRQGQRLKRRFLRRLAGERPDWVVVTGDFLGDAKSAQAVVEALSPIQAATKLFVLGSNDYYSPVFKNPLRYFWTRGHGSDPTRYRRGRANPWNDLVQALIADGWTYLSNRTIDVEGIEVCGLDDAHIGRANPAAAMPRIDERFRVAIAHSPDSAADLIAKGFDLVVHGHTHGGQVRLPGVGALVTNCDIPRSWARGLVHSDRTWLHISAGLGTSMFAPYRFACRPEVSVLTLTSR